MIYAIEILYLFSWRFCYLHIKNVTEEEWTNKEMVGAVLSSAFPIMNTFGACLYLYFWTLETYAEWFDKKIEK